MKESKILTAGPAKLHSLAAGAQQDISAVRLVS